MTTLAKNTGLPLGRRYRAGRGQLLRRDVSGQRGDRGPPRARRLSRRQAGDLLTVELTVVGIPCVGLNGGPAFRHSEAFSFQVATDDQAETDRLWNAIVGNRGQESMCGWCKDKWGLSWQITPRALTAAITHPDRAAATRAFDAMMDMRKIDITAIKASHWKPSDCAASVRTRTSISRK